VDQKQAVLLKFGLAGAVLVMLFVLVLVGKLPADVMMTHTTTILGQLILALGVTGAASAIGASMAGGPAGGSSGGMRASKLPPFARQDPVVVTEKPPTAQRSRLRWFVPVFWAYGPTAMFVLAIALGINGLASCGLAPPQVPVQTAVAAECILRVYAEDTAAHKEWQVILEDELLKCGADMSTASKVIEAHRAAEARELAAPQVQDSGVSR
jgi:hypothetical protein